MKHLKYTAKLEPIVFAGKGFAVTCPDVVIRNRVTDYITEHGGALTHLKPDYCIYTDSPMDGVISLTPIQFWLAAGELDRVQLHELVEASLAYLGSDSALEEKQEEKLLWYIRDNREKVVEEILRQNVTEAVDGYLKRRRQVLPDSMTALSDAEGLDDHILLDLLDDMIEKASQMEKHEMTAYLLVKSSKEPETWSCILTATFLTAEFILPSTLKNPEPAKRNFCCIRMNSTASGCCVKPSTVYQRQKPWSWYWAS